VAQSLHELTWSTVPCVFVVWSVAYCHYLPKYIVQVINVSKTVTELINFEAKALENIAEKLVLFVVVVVVEQHDNFVSSSMFSWIVHFTKFVLQCKKCLLFSKVCQHGLEDHHYFQTGGRSDCTLSHLNRMECSIAPL
jgi:hypothetical protein